MKCIARRAGICTPQGVLATSKAGIAHAASELRFPLIVKHPNGYDSVGMTAKSRVESAQELYQQAWQMIEQFGGTLIEEFIEGREFTVLVAEDPDDENHPQVYAPFECSLPDGELFKHFEFKWVRYKEVMWSPCTDLALASRLKEAAACYFLMAEAQSYERLDFRIDKNGTPFFLESNTYCSMFYPPDAPGSADVILGASPGGHAAFLDLCIRAALKRHRRTRPRFEARYYRSSGYGLYALEDIAKDELIYRGEEQAYYLVTASYVEQAQGLRIREWFHQNAWPIDDSVYAIWDPRLERWKPINHSCDPSAWHSGLDLVARRDIGPGEQITIDYATYTTEVFPSFECNCGSMACRKIIKGTDYLEPWVIDRYGDHLSPHILRRRTR